MSEGLREAVQATIHSSGKKCYRRPAMRDGELTVYFGMADGDGPDVCFMNGDGVQRGHAHYLHSVFCGPRYGFDGREEPSVVEELYNRGFDLTTLRFVIKKKPQPTAE